MSWSLSIPEHEIYSKSQLREIVASVLSLKEHWLRRPETGVYTLGIASYLDGVQVRDDASRVSANNDFLKTHFSEAFGILLSFLRSYLGREARFSDALPLPGFHIFDVNTIVVGETNLRPHFDLQFELWRFPDAVSEVASVTVPIQVPSGGASFEYWPVEYEEFQELLRLGTVSDLAGVERLYPVHQVWYIPGRPCVHRGLPLHRIGPSRYVSPSDHRITLQGHAVHLPGGWTAYW
jgi:hypothetical protein